VNKAVPKVVHFLHIGKTGGTAIKHALKTTTDASIALHLHNHDTKLSDVPRGEQVFFFVRDPIRRFVSGFYSRQRQGQPRYFVPWSTDERDSFENFVTPNDLAEALSAADRHTRQKAARAMQSIGHVRDSYWKWFENEPYFRSRLDDIFFIGFQESFAEDFRILKSLLPLPESAALPDDDSLAHRNPTGLDTTLTARARGNLAEWYEADYAFVTLCREVRAMSSATGHSRAK
jgi:hypothetical protein